MTEQVRHLIGYNRIPLSILVGAFFFLLSKPSVSSLLLGLPWILLGEAIRTWSSGCLDKNKVLQTNGPYAMTRHPLYLGSALIGVGFAMMGKNLAGGLVLVGGLALIYGATILEEEQFLLRCFGEDYQAYRGRVPLFLPRISRATPSGFRWEKVFQHREQNTWWGIGAGVVLFGLKIWASG